MPGEDPAKHVRDERSHRRRASARRINSR